MGLQAVMSKVFLETPRLRLREFTLNDVDRIATLDADPEVMRYISFGAPTPRAVIAEKILPAWLRYYQGSIREGVWAAELKTTGEFIGWFHLRPDRLADAEQELGYRLSRAHWGCGYASEGARALVRDGFAVSHFPKICARTLQANVASQRVMQKCGLAFESEFVYPEYILRGGTEEQRRAVKYSASRHEWLAANRDF